jgi:hypothetical protein
MIAHRPLTCILCFAICLLPAVTTTTAQVPQRPELITPEAEATIKKALKHLANTQGRDGAWRTGSHYGSYPTAMTSLAGLALMAGGNTPVEGEYAPQVRRAVDFVLSAANPQTGLIAAMGEEQRPMFSHGYAMLFLAEAYGMEQDKSRQKRIEAALVKAAELTTRSQSNDGGWLYTPDSGGDEGAVTITQVQGLRAARNAGVKVDKKTIERAINYIEKSANNDGGIRYTARGGGSSRPPITAAAVAVLYNAGQYEHPIAERCLAYIKKLMGTGRGSRLNNFSGHKFYTMLYLSQAMYLSSEENWNDYFPGVRDELIQTQSADGSWQGDSVGTTYGTSIALLTLQLPYKYLPILQR